MKEIMQTDYVSYRLAEWIMLFFIYGFLGWIWESIYMSILERRKLNRGFLHGPCIPIYGTGAVLVLGFTMPFYQQWWMVAIIGMLIGTLMEEIVGRLMEEIFDERYWTYEGYPGNIDNFICVPATLLWGFFAMLMLYFINRPVDYFLRNTNYAYLQVASVCCLLIFGIDLVTSVRGELDMNELRAKMNDRKSGVLQLQRRMNERFGWNRNRINCRWLAMRMKQNITQYFFRRK